jgi:hypothetical protein
MSKSVQKRPKVSKSVQNYPKLSKIVQNGSKLSNICIKIGHFDIFRPFLYHYLHLGPYFGHSSLLVYYQFNKN